MKRVEITLPSDAAARRADRALARCMPGVAAWQLRDAFARRDVRQNGKRIAADAIVSAGDLLCVYLPEEQLPALHIVHEDDRYLVVNKRQGMPTQGEASVESQYLRKTGRPAYACHRLDVQTGGLLLLAKDEGALACAEAAFAEHALEKTYEAVVRGVPARAEATLRAYLQKDAHAARVRILARAVPGVLPIETRYRVLDTRDGCAWLEITLVTGRTHQIRAHLAHIGHPILGDDKYGDRALNRQRGVRRQQLWATRLTLWDGQSFAVEAGFEQAAKWPQAKNRRNP